MAVRAVVAPPRVLSSMAKRKPHLVQPLLTPELASAKAQEKIETLRKYYWLGQRASDVAPDGAPKTPEPLKDLAADAGVEGTRSARP